jgi:tRNA threonylcarbamoyladenosine biosynthesis protein TsaE
LKRYITRNQSETVKLGRRVGRVLKRGTVISLEGSLGAGKTTLVKGIALSLDIQEEVTSPSFTIMSVYEGSIPLYHIDLYRIETDEELDNLGLEDFLADDGVAVIEWGEKARAVYPEHTVRILFDIMKNGNRKIKLEGMLL